MQYTLGGCCLKKSKTSKFAETLQLSNAFNRLIRVTSLWWVDLPQDAVCLIAMVWVCWTILVLYITTACVRHAICTWVRMATCRRAWYALKGCLALHMACSCMVAVCRVCLIWRPMTSLCLKCHTLNALCITRAAATHLSRQALP